MEKTFLSIKTIKDAVENNFIIDREDFEYLISSKVKNESEFIILFTKTKDLNIVPSLSIKILKGKDFFYPKEIKDLYSHSSVFKGFKRFNKKTESYFNKIGFNYLYKDKNRRFIILSSDIIEKRLINVVHHYSNIIRNGSLNYINESLLLSLREAKKFESGYKKSIEKTVESFKKIIESIYDYECSIAIKNSDNTFRSEKDIVDINKFGHLISYGKPLYVKTKLKYVVIFPFTNDRQSVNVNFILVISSLTPIKKYLIFNLTKACNYYFNSYLTKIRLNHISKLQKKIIEIHQPNEKRISDISFRSELKEITELAFSDLVLTTDVHAATFRIFNPLNNQLDLIYEQTDGSVKLREKRTESFSVKKDLQSINVHTFKSCGKDEFFYAKDVKEFKTVPLRNDRKNTISELCFTIYFKNIKIGTLNFESAYDRAFGTQIKKTVKKFVNKTDELYLQDPIFNYLLTIKNLVEDYLESLLESNDKYWLLKRIHIYQNIHELKSLLIRPDIRPEYLKIIKNAFYDKNVLDYKSKKIDLVEFIENFISSKLKAISAISTPLGELALKKVFFPNSHLKNKNILVSDEKISAIEIILKNVFSNFIKTYSEDKSRDRIIILLNKEFLSIHLDFIFQNFNPANNSSYLIKPFNSRNEDNLDESTMHYGFFIIGAITRHLGGKCYLNPKEVGPNSVGDYSTLSIKIPIHESKS